MPLEPTCEVFSQFPDEATTLVARKRRNKGRSPMPRRARKRRCTVPEATKTSPHSQGDQAGSVATAGPMLLRRSQEERRAWDHHYYTIREFVEWYGTQGELYFYEAMPALMHRYDWCQQCKIAPTGNCTHWPGPTLIYQLMDFDTGGAKIATMGGHIYTVPFPSDRPLIDIKCHELCTWASVERQRLSLEGGKDWARQAGITRDMMRRDYVPTIIIGGTGRGLPHDRILRIGRIALPGGAFGTGQTWHKILSGRTITLGTKDAGRPTAQSTHQVGRLRGG